MKLNSVIQHRVNSPKVMPKSAALQTETKIIKTNSLKQPKFLLLGVLQFVVASILLLSQCSNSKGTYEQDDSSVKVDTLVKNKDSNKLLNKAKEVFVNRDYFYEREGAQYNFEDKVTPRFIKKVEGMAKRLGADPSHLLSVMSFESKGTMDPAIQNKYGYTGLIQIGEDEAIELGTTTDALKEMGQEEQLYYVEEYFKLQMKRRGIKSLKTFNDVYSAVIWPAALKMDESKPNSVLFSKEDGKRYYRNIGLDSNKDGDVTKKELKQSIRNLGHSVRCEYSYTGLDKNNDTLFDINILDKIQVELSENKKNRVFVYENLQKSPKWVREIVKGGNKYYKNRG